MKKLKWFLLFALLLTMLTTYGASAATLTVETDLPYSSMRTYMLRNGDALHCLTVSEHTEYSNGYTVITVSMAAQCSALEDGALVPCEDHCVDWFDVCETYDSVGLFSNDLFYGIALSAQNQTYLIDRNWAVYQWTPGEAEAWRYLCTLDDSPLDFENYIGMMSFRADGDTLYACFTEVENAKLTTGTVFAFSLTSGAGEKLFDMPYMDMVYPVDENRMLFHGFTDAGMRFVSLYLYDLTTKKATLFDDRATNGLVPDGNGGWYCVASSGYSSSAIYHYDADGTRGEELASLPNAWWESISLSEDHSTAYTSSASGLLGVCPLMVEDERADHTLLLAGSVNEYGGAGILPDFGEFSSAHGGALLNPVSYPSSFDDLALELLSGSDGFDLMALELSMGNVDSLLNKGYYVNLSDIDSIASYVENLYPTWRDACLRGDEIVGIPINARSVWMFMANLELWREEGLGEIPKTYDELFDCIREWDDMGVLDEVPLFHRRYMPSFNWLHNRIMLDYMGKCKREGKPIVFTDETLLHLLNRLEEVRPILEAHDAKNITGNGLIFEGAISRIDYLTGFMDFEVTAENDTFTSMPLGLTGEGDCVEATFLTLLVVNPNSKRRELAKAYIAYLAEHPTTWAQCYLLKDGPVGVREAGFEELDEQYEQLLAEIEENIAAAMKEGDDAVVNRWEQEKKQLNDDYLNMWEVRPFIAEMLYELRPYFTPLTADGYGFLENSCSDLTQMFFEGRIDSRTYAQRLDQRMQMAELEGGR